MKNNQIKKTMQDIQMSEETKNELWGRIVSKSERQRHFYKKAVIAAAILAILIVPTGVYAASEFGWIWDEVEEKNHPLNPYFQQENGSIEAAGFRFNIERAMCDTNVGVVYYYISATDISGKNRNPRDFSSEFHEDSKHWRVDDIVYSLGINDNSTSTCQYDEKNSTSQKAYFYLESEAIEQPDSTNQIKISLNKIEKVYSDGKTEGTALESKTIKIENTTKLPTLTWQLEEKGNLTVIVSPILARIKNDTGKKNSSNENFELVLSDNSSIKDYFDFNQSEVGKDGTLPENCFTSKSKENKQADTIYRYHYLELNKISGIRINGEFYPVKNAERQPD